MSNLVGKRFGQYELTALIGEGGMGAVYRAQDLRLNRDVAVKILPLDTAQSKQLLQRFIREANTVAGLDHPNIINVYNVGVEQGVYYIVMRLIQGETLGSVIHRHRTLPPERTLRILAQLTDALTYAHQRRIVHRDIKPANIMLESNDRVTLMDFGIAKAPAAEKLTRVGQVIGTLEYMSPEQYAGEAIDPRTDIYALGIVLYQMLTGHVPLTAQMLLALPDGQAYHNIPSPRQHNPQLPPEIEQVILRCLARSPNRRYQTAADLIAAFREAVVGSSYTTLPPANARTPPPRVSSATAFKLILPNGYEFPLQPGVTHIGRTRENHLPINDDQVSRHHAEIHYDPQRGCVFVDRESTNGSFINGRQLEPHRAYPLVAGYQVRLGKRITLLVRPAPPLRSTQPPRTELADTANTTQKDNDNDFAFDDPMPVESARPTVMLMRVVAGWSNRHLAIGLVALVIIAALAVWLGTPIVREIDFIWYNFPLVALIAPIIYMTVQRRWLAGGAHTVVSLIGGWLMWQQVEYYSANDYIPLFLASLISGGFIELWLYLLPKIKGMRSANQTWLVECGWLALMSMLGTALLYGIVDVQELTRWGQWIGSAILGGLGWFVGDMVHQYLVLRQGIEK